MTSTQILCFLSASKTNNFTETANQLHFLPQTVSKNIRALEDELGLVLFHRINNRLELTEAGRYYNGLFSQFHEEIQASLEQIRSSKNRQAKQLRIAFSELLDPGSILPVVEKFRFLYPGVQVYSVQSDTVMGLQRKRSDIAILLTSSPVLESEFHNRPIARTTDRLYVSPLVHLEGENPPLDPNCWGVPVIQSFTSKSTRPEYLYSVKKRLEFFGLTPQSVELLPNMQSVAATLHITPCVTISNGSFGFMSASRHLRSFGLPDDALPNWLCCVWSRSCENTLVEPFVALMEQEFGNNDGSVLPSAFL